MIAVLRLAGALVLCGYLPGWLAVRALFGPTGVIDRYLRVVLAVTLSLVVTMVVGLVVAALGRGIRPVPALAGMLGAGLLLAVAARARGGRPRRVRIRWPAPGYLLAALVPLGLTAVLVVLLVAAARYRPPDAYYTQLSAQPAQGGGQVAVILCRERHPVAYRYEERVDGQLVATATVTLRPGQSVRYPLTGPTGHIEVRLYRTGRAGTYRRLLP